MNCNYTAADGSEPFYVPAPIEKVDQQTPKLSDSTGS